MYYENNVNAKTRAFNTYRKSFFSISVSAGTKYEEKTKDIIERAQENLFSPKPEKSLPNLLILDADENVTEIGYTEGILVINFWATWCAPCKKEMPHLIL